MLLVPAVPATIMAVLPVKESLWLVVLPTVGQQLCINQVLGGEPVTLSSVVLGSAVTLAAGIALLALVTRRYRTEGILFR